MNDEQPPSQSKLIAVMCVVAVADFSLLLFTVYLIYKIFKLVRTTDVPMLLSIISLALALFCFFIYSIGLILQACYFGRGDLFITTDTFTSFLRMMDFGKVAFTFSAFLFDLYKWCTFIVATSADVS